jgi:hypothetical protein
LSFTAKAQNNSQSLLQWATAQEQNTKDFYIQHSANGNKLGYHRQPSGSG